MPGTRILIVDDSAVIRRVLREALAAEGTEKRVWTVKDPLAKNGMRSEAIPAEVKNRFEK